jgi:hypothetical protein
MKEIQREEGLLVRAEPLERAEDISQKMADVVRLGEGTLLLKVDSQWAQAIYTVLVTKGVKVKEIRKETNAKRLIA